MVDSDENDGFKADQLTALPKSDTSEAHSWCPHHKTTYQSALPCNFLAHESSQPLSLLMLHAAIDNHLERLRLERW